MNDLAADLAIAQHDRFEGVWKTLSARERALAEKMIAKVERTLATARRGSWTSAMAASTLVQLAQGVRELSTEQLALLRRALPKIAAQAQAGTASWLRELDKHYLGTARPLRWDSLEWLRGYSNPLMRSRLRIYKDSFARYGASAVSDIEDAVAATVLEGTPWTEAREQVMSIVRDKVEGRQWMVDRIVRTEASTVANATTMAALLEEDDDPEDPMLKKLVATFDAVTANDSRMLHGQTRRLKELFTDVAGGRKFAHPPNRPNDRETVVGWRESWGDDREFDYETRTGDGGDEQAEDVDLDAIARTVTGAVLPST